MVTGDLEKRKRFFHQILFSPGVWLPLLTLIWTPQWLLGTFCLSWREARSFYGFLFSWPQFPRIFPETESSDSPGCKPWHRGQYVKNTEKMVGDKRNRIGVPHQGSWKHCDAPSRAHSLRGLPCGALSWTRICFGTPRGSLRYSSMSHLELIRPWEPICLYFRMILPHVKEKKNQHKKHIWLRISELLWAFFPLLLEFIFSCCWELC